MPRKQLIALVCSLIILLLAVALPAPAQDQEPVTRVFHIEHGNVDQIAEILVMFGGVPRANKELGVIAWQGPKSRLAAVEAAVESLDVPPKAKKNIQLTLYILAALPGTGSAEQDKVPETLQGVTTQIRKLFDFASIRLLESAIIRTRDGEGGGVDGGLSMNRLSPGLLLAEEPLALALADQQGSYHFFFRNLETVADEEGDTIRINRLRLEISLPTATVSDDGSERVTTRVTELVTDIDVREGQKVVVGKTSIEGARDTMFLVVTAEILS
jgi:hypothetical protein